MSNRLTVYTDQLWADYLTSSSHDSYVKIVSFCVQYVG